MDQPPDDVERTRAMRLPPVPRPGGRPADVVADQPTDQLPPPTAREPTGRFGPWQPLEPRVVPRPRRRSRTAVVVPALVLLVVALGVVAVLLWG
jgi:hypothetical protein